MIANRPSGESGPLDTLKALVDSASCLLEELLADPVFARMARLFARIPSVDREPIITLLEREVLARRRSEAARGITGVVLRLNPTARVYTRVIADQPRPDPARAVLTALRAIQVVDRALGPGDDGWKTAAREALTRVGPEERQRIARFAREVVGLTEEAEELDRRGER